MACPLAQSLLHRVTKPWLPMEKPRMYPGGIEGTAQGSSAASGKPYRHATHVLSALSATEIETPFPLNSIGKGISQVLSPYQRRQWW